MILAGTLINLMGIHVTNDILVITDLVKGPVIFASVVVVRYWRTIAQNMLDSLLHWYWQVCKGVVNRNLQ